MVQEISDFDGYIDFINEIAADPCYADPHFQYNKDNLFGAPWKKDQRIFAVKRGGKTEGLFVWLILPDEKYIEMMIGLTRDKDVFMEMFSFLEAQHQGYQFDFVLNPKNDVICGRLKELGAVFGKEQQKMVHRHVTCAASTKQVELLSPEWEEQYRSLHNLDTYWTADKILKAGDRFRVFVAIADRQVVGYLDVTACLAENEPYDLYVKPEYARQGYETALLEKALSCNSPRQMMVLVDVDAEDEIRLYSAVGFEAFEGQNSIYASYRPAG